MIDRLLKTAIQNSSKSILLLGPRQVGKSTLIKSLRPELIINFADEMTLLDYASHPGYIRDVLARQKFRSIFVDEVQKLPSILNSIQALIDDNKKLKFYLTGSSARKLRRTGANLLPGRVLNYQMGPVTLKELDYHFSTENLLRYGSLPEVITSTNTSLKKELLSSYASSYIKEEIKAEALTKSMEAFSRFLKEVTNSVGQFIDYTKLSARAKISRHTCPSYFEILEDTLLGYRIFPDRELLERADLVKHPKFFLFDSGVYNGLLRDFELSTGRIGVLSEQLVFSQLLHSANALRKPIDISTFRTRGGLEVDFLVRIEGKYFAIEVKYSDDIAPSEIGSLETIKAYIPNCHSILVHMKKRERRFGTIWGLPIEKAMREMGL